MVLKLHYFCVFAAGLHFSGGTAKRKIWPFLLILIAQALVSISVALFGYREESSFQNEAPEGPERAFLWVL